MYKLKCPHCHKRGVPILVKMRMGPKTDGQCKACGHMVGLPPYAGVLDALPLLIAIVATLVVRSDGVKAIFWGGRGGGVHGHPRSGHSLGAAIAGWRLQGDLRSLGRQTPIGDC
jgi:hypothetical protein